MFWIIGDSMQDIECGYNANIQSILYGKGKLAEIQYFDEKRKANPPMKNINDFIELIEIFK
jgi:histidinol phosphatase-like enzyme